MATTTPKIDCFDLEGKKCCEEALPPVLSAPLRPDLVQAVHTGMNKNKRQPYANMYESGYGTAAYSWGTGRAVSRIPRVPGGGTHRCGQAAFGNMCRGGGMFAPTKTWRRWHRRVNVTQKRHAVASSLAASALPALNMARGHKIDELKQVPVVITDKAQELTKTKDAIRMLESIGLGPELAKVVNSRRIRAGVGKTRGRRYVQRKGPLVIYAKDDGITRAVRNIPGVETCDVNRMNLLQLAPGAQFGRLIVWTHSAFKHLTPLFGSYKEPSALKAGYSLNRPAMVNADVARIINSDVVQSVVRPAKEGRPRRGVRKSPAHNRSVLLRVCPGTKAVEAARKKVFAKNTTCKAVIKNRAYKNTKESRKNSREFLYKLHAQFASIEKPAPKEEPACEEQE